MIIDKEMTKFYGCNVIAEYFESKAVELYCLTGVPIFVHKIFNPIPTTFLGYSLPNQDIEEIYFTINDHRFETWKEVEQVVNNMKAFV